MAALAGTTPDQTTEGFKGNIELAPVLRRSKGHSLLCGSMLIQSKYLRKPPFKGLLWTNTCSPPDWNKRRIPMTIGGLKMRFFRLLLPLFILATAWAADPFVGNWKLNVAKSDFGSGSKAQSGSTTYETSNGGYVYSSETVYTDERTASLRGPVQFDGTVNEGGLDGRAVTFVSRE
jgi:hypothetical protein